LPNIIDTDVIRALLSRTTCESLRTTKELLDIVTSHASSKEVVGVIFDHAKGKAKRNESVGKGTSNHPGKNKSNNGGSLVAVATGETLDHFKKMLEKPCPNHTFPVKHLYKDCALLKKYLSGGSKRGE
jgi:hypothetical protein